MTDRRIMTEDAAYSKGKQAYVDDRGSDDSPYTGRLREAWEQGWHDMAAGDTGGEPIDLNFTEATTDL